ncbi:MAG: energy-coupling factor transporter ATPase [Christensenellaceae bacterium]|nr:energy-coupling factor transporter ATPase [Christensenellaceae bacterium]
MPIVAEKLEYTYLPGTPFEHKAVSDVNFTIEDGEFVGIIGHTGSGKSTLVQILSRLILPTSGRVLIDGVDYAPKKADRKQLRRKVGVVFQYPEYQLFEETVEKDIAFGPRRAGIPEEEIPSCVDAAMELVGLDPDTYRDKSPFELSGGQKRKVAIAGVLAMRPSILIMDEPIAGLDPMGRESLMELVRRLNSEGMTILMVSHNMDGLAEYASRILVMEKGRLILNGTPREVFSHSEQLRAAGLDLPEAAQLAEQLRLRGVPVPEGLIRFDEVRDFIIEWKGGAAK